MIRTTLRNVILFAPLLACGTGPPPGSSMWILPPSQPRQMASLLPPEPAAAIGAPDPDDVQDPDQQEPRHALELGELLDVVARTYPVLDIAEQRRVVARARQLAALGNFDVELSGFATSDVLGFYQNETAGLFAEQPTGLWGTTFFGGYRIGQGDFDPTFDGARQTNNGGEFSAGVRVPLLRGGATDGRRREVWSADVERDLADADAKILRLQATLAASESYWRWVAAGRGLAVTQRLLELAEERQEGIETRVRRGGLAEIEQIDNERLVVGRQALLTAALRAVDRTAIALSLFLRDRGDDPRKPDAAELPQEFPQGNEPNEGLVEGDVRLALQQRPELQRLLRERDLLMVDRDFYANSALPRLDLLVEGSQDLDRFEPTETKGDFELFVGVEMTIKLQNRTASGRVEELDASLTQLRYEARLQSDRIAAEVRDDFSELRATHERAQQTLRAAELAERVADGERRRFELGDSTVLVLNLREEAAAEAELHHIEALRDYWIAVARYRAAVGEDPTRTRATP